MVLGLGTSVAYPTGMVIIKQWSDRYASAGEPSGVLTAVAFASGAAVALGPPLGGLLVASFGWRSIFWVNLPVAIIALLLGLKSIPVDGALTQMPFIERLRRLDIIGVVLFIAVLCTLLLFLKVVHWQFLAATVVFAILLITWELRASWPFIDLRMLGAHPRLITAYARCVGCYIVFYSFFYSIPEWLQHNRGFDAATSGMITFPMAAMSALSTLAANRMLARQGVALATLIGSMMMLIGSEALLAMSSHTALALLVLLIGVLGIPNGFNSLANQTQMYQAAPPEQIGSASGLYRTMQYVGGGLSTTFLAFLGNSPSDSGLHHLGIALLVLSLILVITSVPMFRRKDPDKLLDVVLT